MIDEVKGVCIIGLDAPEHDLVEKWDLKNLKQKEYGKVGLPIDSRDEAATPVIWTSFITGKGPEEHGITSDKEWRSGFLESLANFKKKMVRKWGMDIFPSWLNSSLARNLGFGYRPIDREDHGLNTIFDLFGNTKAISVVGYNEYEENMEVRNALVEAKNDKISRSEAKDKALEVFERRREEVLDELDGNWKVFMGYFYFLDVIEHLFYYDEDFIKEMYEKATDLVKEINKKLDKNTLLLIISDHGQKQGHHTTYGFYSANKKLGLKSPEMISFYDIIAELLGAPSKEKEREIKEHLEKLGYKA